jgi:hypothetical protein
VAELSSQFSSLQIYVALDSHVPSMLGRALRKLKYLDTFTKIGESISDGSCCGGDEQRNKPADEQPLPQRLRRSCSSGHGELR